MKKEREKTPCHSPFLQLSCPVVQGGNRRQILATSERQLLLARSLSATWVPLSWAWGAKQPWGQETLLRKDERSGPCKVGGVRVYAPPLLAPKFSPDGPSATVPVLGCSCPEESYPSLANQPSSGAKQGDEVREGQWPPRGPVLCLLSSLVPMASTPSTCLGVPCLLTGSRL